jgi:hypothetical protein
MKHFLGVRIRSRPLIHYVLIGNTSPFCITAFTAAWLTRTPNSIPEDNPNHSAFRRKVGFHFLTLSASQIYVGLLIATSPVLLHISSLQRPHPSTLLQGYLR